MQLHNMLRFKTAWAEASGPRHEVVLSTRVRLARIDRYFERAKEKLLSVDEGPIEGRRDAYSFMSFALAPEPRRDGRPAAGAVSQALGCGAKGR